MNRKLLVILLPLLLITSACSASNNSATKAKTQTPQKITLMLDWTPNTNHSGIYLAKERGYYSANGIDLNIIQPGEQGALASLGSGSVDFGISVQESLIPAQTQGVPAVSIAGLLSTNTSSLMSLSSDGITRPKDLEGKTYGGFGGELERKLISNLVSCDGGDPNKVKFVDVGNVDYKIGLEQNRFDFVWVFEGWEVIGARQQGASVNTLKFADHFNCIPDWYTPLIATSQKTLDTNPGMVRSFLEATEHGYKDAVQNPSAAADALLKGAPELDEKLVRESSTFLAKYYIDNDRPWGEQSKDIWTKFASFLKSSGLITTDIDVNKSFTNQFLPDQK